MPKLAIRWLGHATFEITTAAGTKILLDPFLLGNPSTPKEFKSLDRYAETWKPDVILVTHSHGDHCADLVEIAKKSGAPVITEYELAGTFGLPESQTIGGNVGGKVKIAGVTVHLMPAVHSSTPGGRPLGFVIECGDGETIYASGDTWIFGDMALIHEIYQPTILLMNMGGGPYTQDPKTAALAIKKYFQPRAFVPLHWGTFPPLATEAEIRAAFPGDDRLVILKPGEERAF